MRRTIRTTRTASTMRPFTLLRTHRALGEPTLYADAALTRLLKAVEHRTADLDASLAEYVRARREAGVRPERVIVEFKRVVRRLVGAQATEQPPTSRLIELYFAA